MAEIAQQTIIEVVEYIKKEILPALPLRIDQLDDQDAEALRDKIHILRYYCLQKGFDSQLIDRFDTLLEISHGLWELLDQNSNTFMYLKEMYKIRWLDLGADLITQFEEASSGEDTLRDIFINSIATYMGWLSDTIWVDVAKIDQFAAPKVHAIRLRDELWRFLSDSDSNINGMSLGKAIDIGEKMKHLTQLLISDEIPPVGRAFLLSNIYTLLMKLNIDKIILSINTNSEITGGNK
jgi:hypothetical protein